jgi:signal transduction histidine kinase
MIAPRVFETTPLQRVWPWVLSLLVLIGTAASNQAADVRAPVLVAVGLVAVAMLPTVAPGLAAHAGLPPGSPLLLTGVMTAGYFALGYADGPVFLALPAATFVVASACPVRRWVWWAAGAVAPVWLGLAADYLWWRPEAGHQLLWQGAGAAAIVAATGAVATAARSRLEARAERVGRAATEERLRMAQELHDGVGHGLSVIAMQAGVALHVLERDPEQARTNLEAIRETSKESLEALRAELAAMSGDAAPRRPASGTADVPALVDRVRGAGLAVEVVGTAGDVPDRVGEVCYVVVQEALTNVLRHANATRATVALERVDGVSLVVSVTDDGRGSEPGAVSTGLGLGGLESRVAGVGGTFEAGPAEVGFRVRATLPLTEEAR